jgi:hypothetical protein
LWSDTIYVGVMAQEVAAVAPEAVVQGADGYLRVDYSRLGLQLLTLDEWSARRSPVGVHVSVAEIRASSGECGFKFGQDSC